MNRNTQSHFATIPSMDISRSKFDRSFVHKTTCNTGELVPIYVDPDIVPGDTVTMKMSDLIRMTTPITPVMDDLKADFFFFFVPNRLVWDHFKRFMGENDTAPWIQTTEYTVPQIKISNESLSSNLTATVLKGSVLDHMGIPTNNSWKLYKATVTDPDTQESTKRNITISGLPTRAYSLIWNEFFRSEALQNPVSVPKDDNTYKIINTRDSGYISNPESSTIGHEFLGGLPCLKVCKTFDYFTACLPRPQAGSDVTLPMNGTAPIRYGERWNNTDGVWETSTSTGMYADVSAVGGAINLNAETKRMDPTGPTSTIPSPSGFYDIYADLTLATGATINQLRTAFAIQKWQEREARGGQRYTEMVRSHFNTINPDFRLQRPEYLGGFTHQISMNQVLSQGNDASGAPIGTTGAYSLSVNKNGDVFSHSFTEHGILLGLMCIRQNQHTYQQGINRAWFKKERFDFYTPEFANLGETYVELDEIYAQGTSEDKDAFGYQERWAEMRYMPDLVSGEMRSDYPQSLDIWHYADYYDSKPELGNKWIREGTENVNRTLAVQDQDQFKVDLYFGAIYTRPLPVYSVPGLLDHH